MRFSSMEALVDESKEVLLKQVDGLRDLIRRVRRLADGLTAADDRDRLRRYAEELEENAARLEKEAAGAKTGG